ncbi:glycosyltransferase family 4 protein [Aquiflexum sp.]|uniref:glycosyltransferase family 4 protein n=1 Tax=Aquiflexum sp. TaxID=1872584 RepID=UPI00359404C7
MRILLVCKANFEPSELNFQKNRAYIYDQFVSLKENVKTVDVFFLNGTGIWSYFRGAFELRDFLKKNYYDIVHAHYGYCGLIVGLVSRFPVAVTYHGTDITEKISNIISLFSILLANWNIFVSEKIYRRAIWSPKNNFSIIPCGVDLEIFKPTELENRSMKKFFHTRQRTILFSSSFSNKVKNYPLAKESLLLLEDMDAFLIELKDKTRVEVAELLNDCDILLLTSFSEGSPQIVKEAMACNCPIVSTDVGEVKNIIGDTDNCFVTGFDKYEIAEKIKQIFNNGKRSNGRKFIYEYSNERVVPKIIEVYNKVLSNTKG